MLHGMVLLGLEFTIFVREIKRITCARTTWRASRFCILLCKHFLASRLANGRELAFAINANVVAGVVADRVGFTVLERFCKAVLYFFQISASRLWTGIGRVRNVRSDFGLGCLCVGLA